MIETEDLKRLAASDFSGLSEIMGKCAEGAIVAQEIARALLAEREAAEKWERFSRSVIGRIFAGDMEVDGMDIQDMAHDLGILEEVPYDPKIHGDGPRDYDVEPGETIFAYRALTNGEGE